MPDRFDEFGERCAEAYSDADRAMYGRDGGMELMAKEKLASLIAAQAREAFGGRPSATLTDEQDEAGVTRWTVILRHPGGFGMQVYHGEDETDARDIADCINGDWPADADGVRDV